VIRSVLLSLFLLSALVVRAENVSPEERDKQSEFKKAFASLERTDHLKAIELLEGCTHPSTRQLLAAVITTSKYPEVKHAAFARLSMMPATDPSLSILLANLFKQEKPTDVETKCEYAKAMKNSEFHYAPYEAMADYGSKLRYPDLFTGGYRSNTVRAGGTGTNGGDPNYSAKKQRKEFEDFLSAFSEAVKDSKIKVDDRNSPAQFRKWFEDVRVTVLKKDRELMQKYVAEAREKSDKDNPLLLGKEKDSTTAETPEVPGAEKKEDAKKAE
jgi:hypothetical protein